MKSHSVQQTDIVKKNLNRQQAAAPGLSNDAFYLMLLASQLKRLLGPASLQYFLATGRPVAFIK
jgi:hypothetical protein